MTRWEYMTARLPRSPYHHPDELHTWGQEGWELVAMDEESGWWVLVFKRQSY